MTGEHARNLLHNSKPKDNNAYSIMLNEALDMAIKALEEQEHSSDCISRQAVLDLCERFDGCVPYSVLYSHDILPSVSAEKTGHWIYDGRNKICSECNFKIDTWHDTDIGGKRLNYCPKCGTKMEVSE